MSNYEVMKLALEKIATVNAMDYEYQAWAREALEHIRLKQTNQYSDIVSTGGMDPRN